MLTKKSSIVLHNIDAILPYLWGALWLMPIFSLKGSLLAIWLFGLIVITRAILRRPVINFRQLQWLALPALLFVWYLISFLLTGGTQQDWIPIEKKSALLLIPVLMLLALNLKGINLKWAMRGFIAGLVVSGVHLLGRAILMIITGEDMSKYTYHGFTAPYHPGAIYYSWYLSIGIIYLLFRRDDELIRPIRKYLLTGFLVLLMLAASKLFIILVVPLVIWKIISQPAFLKKRVWASILGAVLLFVASLPFLQRMEELGSGSLETVTMDQYKYDTPLNGVTLRMIQWRFGSEILTESGGWLFGTGAGRSQALLNEKYIERGLYTGNPDLGDSGYLDYNFHNQYIETLVSTGIPGLLILLSIVVLIFIQKAKMLIFPLPVYLITVIFFLTESVLERQAGIVIATLMLASLNAVQPSINTDNLTSEQH